LPFRFSTQRARRNAEERKRFGRADFRFEIFSVIFKSEILKFDIVLPLRPSALKKITQNEIN
jgi:hypothetical protein